MGRGSQLFHRFSFLVHALAGVMRAIPPLGRTVLLHSRGVGVPAVALRYSALKALARACGTNVYIDRDVRLKNVEQLSVGSNVSVHCFTYIDAVGGVELGDNVSIAHGCSLVSFEHGYEDASIPIKYNPILPKKIVVADNVWLGAGVRVLAGSTIGPRTVIAAGAVVKGELEGGAIYGGVPARLIRTI